MKKIFNKKTAPLFSDCRKFFVVFCGASLKSRTTKQKISLKISSEMKRKGIVDFSEGC